MFDTNDLRQKKALQTVQQSQQTAATLYISGRLTLIRAANCGEWINPGPLCDQESVGWHRRLTAQSFLWLQGRVNQAIAKGTLSKDFSDALQTLDWIRSVGIEAGVFADADIGPGASLDPLWSFTDGLPAWADTADF